ncbi:MAG: hypothetical protein CMJ83_09070 [Planctomycetes bacterium]|nr:hypothetical protein [Planctomycetota bacterium]
MHTVRLTVRIVILLLTIAPFGFTQRGGSSLGHALTRHRAELGELPQPGDVIIQDIFNYHQHRVALPRAGKPLALEIRFGGASIAPRSRTFVQIGIATQHVYDMKHLPPINVALVIDRSGSMASAGKMSRVQEALSFFIKKLRPRDRIALVAFDTKAEVLVESAPLGDGAAVRQAITALVPEESTNIHAGLMLGYAEALRHLSKTGTNRVLLLTDGIANVGETDSQIIEADSKRFNDQGVDLAVIGVGNDLNRDLLRSLATAGRGLCHFLGDSADVRKVFVQEAQSLVAPCARRPQLTITLDPALRIVDLPGYTHEKVDGGVQLQLDDLNQGATQIVLLDCAVSDLPPGTTASIVAKLAFQDADGKARTVISRTAVPVTRRAPADVLEDHEVRKSWTIAAMAVAMAKMAEHAAAGKIEEARDDVRRALTTVRERFAGGGDSDIKQTTATLRAYERLLGAVDSRGRAVSR